MRMRYIVTMLAVAALMCGCHRGADVDPLLRSRADGLNRKAFLCRYRDPQLCIDLSQQALRFVADSLPQYVDGALRATNNMAFARYQMADYEGAMQLVEGLERRVESGERRAKNGEIELTIARLVKARLLQRQCRIADSYRLLHDIERSGRLGAESDDLLYCYAQTEYYITKLVLNFHYRGGKEADVRTLVEEVEQRRPALRVDYAQDMALNYALAYGWQSAGESLTALDYCDDNLAILDLPGAFCTFHYANTLQMMALALKSLPGTVPPDSVLSLYDEARLAFFDYCDPYQMLGGTTSTARYALLVGDTLKAHEVLQEWRALRGTWKPFSAPKMELGYFDVLIRSRLAKSADEDKQWFEHYTELQDHIKQSEKEDFALQQTLESATRRSRWMTVAAMVAAVGGLLLALLAVLLWLSRRRLRREKQQLEEANRRDVERIAGVETALSVMRHDVSPFASYLRRPDLDPGMRNEILGQMLRTFDNIKNWTSLSVPSGLAFNASTFAVQELFDDVRGQVIAPHDGVSLVFEPTALRMHGDRMLMIILLRNLVNNALQHTENGSVRVSCQLSVASCQLSVASGQLSVVSGQLSVVSGQLPVASGQLSVASCQLSVASGQLSVASGQLADVVSLSSGNQQLATDNQQLATDNQQLATDNQQLATDNQQLATDNQQLATMLDITVADTGSGMNSEQCEALFRADRELPAGSEHGFGLILCRYIIKKHDDLTRRGCKLWVESTEGKGTTMHCRVAAG